MTLTSTSLFNRVMFRYNEIGFSFRVKKELYLIGISTYDAERTICDVLRGHSDADIQLITDALKNYVKLENKDIIKLSTFAKMFRVEKKLRSYLEVLLL